mmetsp:Transcript_29661/g.45359  ORF Transcript_29661/g.45359 Transcript_29661/m.45359 type:complete len:697 (+) Transcript_29661:88-2178(+)|eukprot:CAMPEP_0194087246 /NCGR_PEP_ID=MMETSP0149-20130528/24140_1 /TAXON_ID=122233 /ORGANISM="Chaetoceros debilis, Strain MM31A-1" /LENGTH=696 /DNA_ID=CAMNT_0038770535 /DNA_START=57 /DNA_END=2147 /DNA_ORIENTATION=+
MKRNLILIPVIVHLASGLSASTRNGSKSKSINTSRGLSDRLLSLARSGRTDEAIAVYYEAWESDATRPSTRMMNNAIGACARPYNPRDKEAFEIFHHGIEKGLKPNVYTFGSLMSAFAKKGNVKQCTSLLQEMEKYKILPNSVIYSTAISSCERCSPPKSNVAFDLLKEGVNQGSIDGFMNIVGYNAAISVCARSGEWRLACQLLDEMEGRIEHIDPSRLILNTDTFIPKPDEVTYGTVMAACERGKEWKKVLELSKRMEDDREDLIMDGISISSALHACQQLALGQESLEFLNKMNNLDNGKDSRNRGNRKRKALKGPDGVAYRLAASACARGDMIPQAIELLKNMKEVTGSSPDVVAYSAVIGGCAEAGDWIQAFELLKEMKRKGIDPNVITFSAAISACANASANAAALMRDKTKVDYGLDADQKMNDVKNPMRAALALLKTMKEIGGDVEPNIVSYNAAIRACAEGLNVERAFALLDDLLERGLEPTIITYGTLMTACERVEDVEGASKVFKVMKDQDMRPNEIIYGAAISCCRKASNPERTLLLLRKMLKNDLKPNTAVFNTVIMAQVEAKNTDKASAVYNLLNSSHAKNAGPNRQTYNILIRAMAANSNPMVAEHYLKLMGQGGMKPDVDLYTVTVSSYERIGEPIKALNLMESMREEGYDFYNMKLFDVAFKQGVKVINTVVGKGSNGE